VWGGKIYFFEPEGGQFYCFLLFFSMNTAKKAFSKKIIKNVYLKSRDRDKDLWGGGTHA